MKHVCHSEVELLCGRASQTLAVESVLYSLLHNNSQFFPPYVLQFFSHLRVGLELIEFLCLFPEKMLSIARR